MGQIYTVCTHSTCLIRLHLQKADCYLPMKYRSVKTVNICNPNNGIPFISPSKVISYSSNQLKITKNGILISSDLKT